MVRRILRLVVRGLFRPEILGRENLPKEGSCLLVAQHASIWDALLLEAAVGHPLRWLATPTFPLSLIHQILKKILDVQAPPSRLSGDRAETWAVLAPNQPGIPPSVFEFRDGLRWVAAQKEIPAVPVVLDFFWWKVFSSRLRGHGGGCRPILHVEFGPSKNSANLDASCLRQALMDLDERALARQKALDSHLGWLGLHMLAHHPWRLFLVDRYPSRRTFSRGMLLAISLALAHRWRQAFKSQRIGLVLPPGIGATAANLALALMDKVPVNLNFTMGAAAVTSCLRRAEIDRVISSPALQKKFPDFPWPADTLDLAAEIRACGKAAILLRLAMVWLLPPSFLARLLKVPREGGSREAVLLFTSGSVGEPKGVPLTHRNVVGNVMQVAATGFIDPHDTMVAMLPIFHSFGSTVTLWYPLLRGVRMVTLPSPLEIKSIAEAIHEEKATLSFGTSSFLRPYLRRAEREQLRSLRFVVAGAEKLAPDLAEAFESKFGITILEGYGLTETTPVASVNLPETNGANVPLSQATGRRPGSAGRLLPGVTARIMHLDTGLPQPLTTRGILHLRGVNIFGGYLHDPERNAQVLHNGWFVTGDMARFDEEGFLYIEGRLSRFSKIAGEMVPHGTIEQKIIELFGAPGADAQPFAVVGVRDAIKGEALVLLATQEVNLEELRIRLSGAGLPNLWIPRTILRVEKIPLLPSGKLDLGACERLASTP